MLINCDLAKDPAKSITLISPSVTRRAAPESTADSEIKDITEKDGDYECKTEWMDKQMNGKKDRWGLSK